MPLPTLPTERLLLRPFDTADAPAVQGLAGDREVASNTLTIPHPYEDGMAEAWIEGHAGNWAERKILTLAVTTAEDGVLGAIGIHLKLEHLRGELGYWIGVPFWNRGYATEAAGAMIEFGFFSIGLNRIEAHHFTRNPASGRVMEKLGMTLEGVRREHVLKDDTLEDLALYAILHSDPGRG
jgi:ribosomal-protein-alanine N-acetyltransferase